MISLIRSRAAIMMAAVLTATLLVYWVGLDGPFLLDDQANLNELQSWLDGKIDLRTVLFDLGQGTFGRPVSMATLALNAWLGGYIPSALKLGNLIVHLLCGLAIFGFLRQLLPRDPLLRQHASLYAAFVAALWLLHPLHASTVLYAVQRMAQMASLMTLLGLWLYVACRQRLAQGPNLPASLGLLLGIPAIACLAFLSKENGILLTLLCGVVELTYFSDKHRPRPVRVFITIFLILPAIVGLAWFALRFDRFSNAFYGRDFDMLERLLSQGRTLCDYLGKLLLPNPPTMGLYTDDFAVSRSLLSPPTTLASLLLLAVVSTVVWRVRKRMQAVTFGWLFFLAGHSLEAGIIPLELYFEHRNYLPSVGILVMLVGLAKAAGDVLDRKGIRTDRIGTFFAAGALAVLAFGTHGRAQIWQSNTLIAETSLSAHPDSLRANAAAFGAALETGNGARADQILQGMMQSSRPRTRSIAYVLRVFKDCSYNGRARVEDLEAFVEKTPMPLTNAEPQPFIVLFTMTAKTACKPITDHMFGDAMRRLADRDAAHANKFLLRYWSARYLARAEDWEGSLAQSRLAWESGANLPAVSPLILAQINTGDVAGAEQTWQEARTRTDYSNPEDREQMEWLRGKIDKARLKPSESRPAAPSLSQ